jgi:hypothetical protein
VSERKEEVRVDLVPLFERWADFGCIFLGALRRVNDCGGQFVCGFRKVLSVHYMW